MVSQPDATTTVSAAVITHRQAPLAVLERMPRGDALPPALHAVVRGTAASGAVGLSTCNRFELYLEAPRPVAREALVDQLHDLTGVPREPLEDCLEVLHGNDAVRHLFAVAAGLQSRLLGEAEIVGQVRAATQLAEHEGVSTPGLSGLFQWALRTGRRARRAAGLAEGGISLADRAVEVLEQRLHPLAGRTVLLLGSGQMAGRAMSGLRGAGARPVLLVRRPESVRRTGVPVRGLDELPVALGTADAVLCATSAPEPLLDAAMLRRAAAGRRGRPPLVVIDLAVPRNVEAPAGALDGVCLLDLDGLTDGDPAPALEAAVARALEVVDREARVFCGRREQARVGPLIEGVLRRGESIRRAELARAARLAPSTDPRVLDELTARVLHKVLHGPIAAMRTHAEAGDTDVAGLIAAALAPTDSPQTEDTLPRPDLLLAGRWSGGQLSDQV